MEGKSEVIVFLQRVRYFLQFFNGIEVKIPKHGKKDKHAPQELSSKIRVRRHKAVDISNQVRG